MKNQTKILLSLTTSALVCLSFPKWNHSSLAWVALVPALVASARESEAKAFAYGLLAGWAAFCGILYWIIPTFQAAHVALWTGVLSLLLLAGYVALYYGAFFAMLSKIRGRFSPDAAVFLGTALWVALEYLRNHFLSGFPWGSLGYSQWREPAHIQIARFTGIYGVSALIVFFNLLVSLFILERTAKRWTLIAAVAIFGFVFAFSRMGPPEGTPQSPVQFSIL